MTYFVTWRLHPEQMHLRSGERTLVESSLQHFDGQRYHLLADVVMDDHVHAICQPFDGHRLEQVVHSWKSFTANQMRSQHGRTGRVWLDEYFDRIVRDEAELRQKLYYVLNNPRKRWPDVEEYEWVGMHRLLEPELGR